MSGIGPRNTYKQKALELLNAFEPHAQENLQPELEKLQAILRSEGAYDREEFNRIRQVLITELNGCNAITQKSRPLWGLLSMMAKIQPINDTDIFDLTTPVLHTGFARKGWFYASTGHAFPLQNLVKCQHQGKFSNPCFGAQHPFNHADQTMITNLARKHNIAIPNPSADTERFINNLHRRFLLRSINFGQELLAQVPAIAKDFYQYINSKSMSADLKIIGQFLLNNPGYAAMNLLPLIAYSGLFKGSPINSISMFLATQTVTLATSVYQVGLRQIFTKLDSPFYLLSAATAYGSVSITKFLSLANTDNVQPVVRRMLNNSNFGVANYVLQPVVNGLNWLTQYIDTAKIQRWSKAAVQRSTKFWLSIVVEKINHEADQFISTANTGPQARALFQTGRALLQDMNEEIQSGLTSNIQDYLGNLAQQAQQVMAANLRQQMQQMMQTQTPAPGSTTPMQAFMAGFMQAAQGFQQAPG